MKFPTARDPFMKKSNNKFILKNYCMTITWNSYKYEIKKEINVTIILIIKWIFPCMIYIKSSFLYKKEKRERIF